MVRTLDWVNPEFKTLDQKKKTIGVYTNKKAVDLTGQRQERGSNIPVTFLIKEVKFKDQVISLHNPPLLPPFLENYMIKLLLYCQVSNP